VHHSKVKSLKLDAWETSLLKVMGELGNNVINSIYLAKVDVMDSLGIEKASPDCTRYNNKYYFDMILIFSNQVYILTFSNCGRF